MLDKTAEIFRGYFIPSKCLKKINDDILDSLFDSGMLHTIDGCNDSGYIFGNRISELQPGTVCSCDKYDFSDEKDYQLMIAARSHFGKDLPHPFPKTYFTYRIV